MSIAALMASFYLSGGGAFMDARPVAPISRHWDYDINVTKNPYGVAEAGFEFPFGRLSVIIAGRHISSIPANDFGTNTIEFRVKWRPFSNE